MRAMTSQERTPAPPQDEEVLSDLEEERSAESEWAPFREWAEKLGRAALHALKLDEDSEYLAWLQAQVGVGPTKWTSSTETVALHHLRADFSNKSGYRAINTTSLLRKMRDIVVAKQWRDWDIAVMAQVPEMDQTDQPSDTRPRYVDFHYRGCALHVICYSFMLRGLDLPPWAVGLVRTIKVKWEGQLSKVSFLARGFGQSIAMQEGTAKVTWLDIVLQMINDPTISKESGAGSLQVRLFQISPEHAAKLNDWKNVRSLLFRVNPEARVPRKWYGWGPTAMRTVAQAPRPGGAGAGGAGAGARHEVPESIQGVGVSITQPECIHPPGVSLLGASHVHSRSHQPGLLPDMVAGSALFAEDGWQPSGRADCSTAGPGHAPHRGHCDRNGSKCADKRHQCAAEDHE